MSAVTAAVSGLASYAAPVGLGIMAGSQILGGLAAYGEGSSQAAALNANAKVAEQQAKNAAAQEREKYRRLASSQRAAYGASGLDVNYGSPLDVLADTYAEGEVSAMNLLYSGKLEAWNARQKAAAAKSGGRSGLLGGILGGVGTGLYGLSKMGTLTEEE